jgi:hypothetical protein
MQTYKITLYTLVRVLVRMMGVLVVLMLTGRCLITAGQDYLHECWVLRFPGINDTKSRRHGWPIELCMTVLVDSVLRAASEVTLAPAAR